MKTLKLLVVFVVLIACSQIGLSQTEKTYVVDIQGNAMKFESESKLINLCFDADVPELTDQQVSQLLKDRKIERSRHNLKGRYELGILFYVPRVEVDSCFLSQDGTVSYKPFPAKDQPKVFSWWFLFAVVGIVCMIIVQIKRNNVFVFAFAIVFAFVITIASVSVSVFAFAFASAFASVSVFAFASAVAFAFAIASAIVDIKTKKTVNILAYIYYGCTVVACVLAYMQL